MFYTIHSLHVFITCGLIRKTHGWGHENESMVRKHWPHKPDHPNLILGTFYAMHMSPTSYTHR